MRIRLVEISVGTFIFAGIIALAFLAIKVSGLNVRDSAAESYSLHAQFNNAAGLTLRAQVTIAGVVIGRVSAINLDPKNNRAVIKMAIQKDVNYITTDSIAAIQTAGVLGEKYIAISNGGNAEYLGEGGEISDTQSTIILEDIIGKLVTNAGEKKEK